MTIAIAKSAEKGKRLTRWSLQAGLDSGAAQEMEKRAQTLILDKETAALSVDLSALAAMTHDGLLALLHLARACHGARIELSLLCSPAMEALLRHLGFDGVAALERVPIKPPPPPPQM